MNKARIIVVGLVIAVLTTSGIIGYRTDAQRGTAEYVAGSDDPNRVELDVTLQRVDTAARELDLRVIPLLRGTLAEDVSTGPAKDLVVDTSSLSAGALRFKAHDRLSLQNVRFGVDDGLVSDYPFDTYSASIEFYVTFGDENVPVSLRFRSYDSLFTGRLDDVSFKPGLMSAHAVAGRSIGSSALAWFLMVVMWALALTVLGAALTIVAKDMGLVWPAMGWMAATLFALVGFRNAAPGSPPIGALIDYGAFYWSELLTTVSLIYVTWHGIRLARAG
ncbi:DUF4436 family protein [Kutzneria sp. CA-103260]|uniref:DUF4436 family protein n=1 Tax=Kutzneria sp. CA-103260 TaxID=2802641 RepID=UPI001BAB8D29|nr:DUF4436 family protein [Kutzneria sp. CA-103260]QUQ66527.1 hypothetical protein JJ691_42550 [Kutzneria sp. CA-103260]